MKVLYNDCYGGFGFSEEFVKEFNKRYPEKKIHRYSRERVDPDIIALVEEMGLNKSSGVCAKIRIQEIPDDVEYDIHEYDGEETVSWHVPNVEVIQDLLDMVKGRKKEEETSKFTQLLLKEDCSMYTLRRRILEASLPENPWHRLSRGIPLYDNPCFPKDTERPNSSA